MNLLAIIVYGVLGVTQPTLQLEITGLKVTTGYIMIAVYASEDSFLTSNVVASGKFEANGTTVKGQLQIPFGSYGISVFQDLNSNGELDTKLFGLPKEPIGFSNNARGSFGPPGYNKVVFDFKQERQIVKISLY